MASDCSSLSSDDEIISELEAFIDEVRKLFCETESDVVVEPSVNKLLDE